MSSLVSDTVKQNNTSSKATLSFPISQLQRQKRKKTLNPPSLSLSLCSDGFPSGRLSWWHLKEPCPSRLQGPETFFHLISRKDTISVRFIYVPFSPIFPPAKHSVPISTIITVSSSSFSYYFTVYFWWFLLFYNDRRFQKLCFLWGIVRLSRTFWSS